MTDTAPESSPKSNAPVVLRIIAAIFLILLMVIGLAGLIFTTGDWISNGFEYPGWDRTWAPLYILPSSGLILLSTILLGVILRFARWPKARDASLFLAILSAGTIVLAARLMMSCYNEGEIAEGWWSTMIVAVLALAVVSVPPLLHWWNASQAR